MHQGVGALPRFSAKWEVVGTLLEKEDNCSRSTGKLTRSGSAWKLEVSCSFMDL